MNKKTKKSSKKAVKKTTTKTLVLRTALPVAWGSVVSGGEIAVFVKKCATIYGIPPIGINIVGNQPYINKDGRLFLLNDIRKGPQKLVAIRTEFLQMSTVPDMAAICKKTLSFKDGLEVEGIGEAAPGNVKLADVKKTLNMMAETRALNRAIWQAIAGDVWNRVSVNLRKANLTEDEEKKVAQAGAVSYEEVESVVKKPQTSEKTVEEKLVMAMSMIENFRTRESIAKAYKNIESSKVYNEEQKSMLIGKLMTQGEKLAE